MMVPTAQKIRSNQMNEARTDVLTPRQRRACMSSIRSRDTKPEILVRKALFAEGFRYRLNARQLPGRPDLVFPKYGAVIFVHGCFWHGHGCHLFKWPRTNRSFWRTKIEGNIARDVRVRDALRACGWRTLTVWECALRGRHRRTVDDLVEHCAQWLKSGVGEKRSATADEIRDAEVSAVVAGC